MNGDYKRYRIGLMCKYPGGLEDGVIRGVVDYAKHNTNWQFVADGHMPFKPFEQIELSEVDGVIGFFIEREWADMVNQAGIHAVDTSEHHADLPVSRVTTDNKAVGRMGASHLLSTGASHFVFVTIDRYTMSQHRLAGFEEVMNTANRPFDVWIVPQKYWENRADWIAQQLAGITRPIGIMGHSDYMVTDVVNGAIRQGLRIPEDIAVIGVEKDPWASTVAEVALSSIELDTHRIGVEAAKMLEGLLRGESVASPQYIAPIGVQAATSTDISFNQDPIVSQALALIREHFADEELTVEDILDQVRVSRPTLLKRMKQATGMTTYEAICHTRIEEGKRLLIHTDATIEQIAFRCGFRCQPRFNEMFKRLNGMSPGEHRRRGSRRC